jgi:UDP-GlcNAc3NAcA epimerase
MRSSYLAPRRANQLLTISALRQSDSARLRSQQGFARDRMARRKILTVVGARPQFIKAAPVSRAIAGRGQFDEVMVHTGQHFDRGMSDVFFEELGIPEPAYVLGIHGGGHGSMTGRMMISLEEVISAEKPDAVLIYGDTNSTLAGALVAAKLCIPIAHVEAGLRSFRPMPEETNRILADRVSQWLFCPTPTAVENLRREGIIFGVHQIGDVMYDATLMMRDRAREKSDVLNRLGLTRGDFQLATLHRAENTDDRNSLARAVEYLGEAAEQSPVVLPLHPRTREAADRFAVGFGPIKLIEPVGHLDMMALLDGCSRVLTDSGGVQKEAYFFRKPCVTLRDATEWMETVEAGWNRLWTDCDYAPRRDIPDYGDGNAAEKVVGVLHASL